jgi:hypothetical protein
MCARQEILQQVDVEMGWCRKNRTVEDETTLRSVLQVFCLRKEALAAFLFNYIRNLGINALCITALCSLRSEGSFTFGTFRSQ